VNKSDGFHPRSSIVDPSGTRNDCRRLIEGVSFIPHLHQRDCVYRGALADRHRVRALGATATAK
jgi:hypothetical protein